MTIVPMLTKFGNKAKNQYIYRYDTYDIFKSYGKNIAVKFTGTLFNTVYIDKYLYNYSRTTSFYRRQFLGEGIAETRKKMVDNEYRLSSNLDYDMLEILRKEGI